MLKIVKKFTPPQKKKRKIFQKLPEDQTKYLKYILNKWITRGIKKARDRGRGAQSSGRRAQGAGSREQGAGSRAQGAELRAQALQAEAFFGIRSFSEGFSEGLAQGKKAESGEQGAEGKMQGREQGGKFQIF